MQKFISAYREVFYTALTRYFNDGWRVVPGTLLVNELSKRYDYAILHTVVLEKEDKSEEKQQ